MMKRFLGAILVFFQIFCFVNSSRMVGKPCTTTHGKGGKCIFSFEKKKLCKDLQGLTKSSDCGENRYLRCCPVEIISKTNIPPPTSNFECGQSNPSEKAIEADDVRQVVGGKNASIGEFPWMVSLKKMDKTGGKIHFCGGVLVNEQIILTAAHCANLEPSEMFAVFAEFDQSSPSSDVFEVEIKSKNIHPEFNPKLGYHDIALLTLTKPVTFSKLIRPICFPWTDYHPKDLLGEKVTLAGWGKLKFNEDEISTILQKVDIKVYDTNVCEEKYSTLPSYSEQFPENMNDQNVLCAGSVQGGKGSCRGDSGGPVMLKTGPNQWTLVGIVSRGHGCALEGFPGIYTPLINENYLNWIKVNGF